MIGKSHYHSIVVVLSETIRLLPDIGDFSRARVESISKHISSRGAAKDNGPALFNEEDLDGGVQAPF